MRSEIAWVPDGYASDVCKPGTIQCCRYLVVNAGGFGCAKHTDLHQLLDGRVEARTIRAVGDNCPGYWERQK